MSATRFGSDEWALILGGSSGFGLATAHKLSEHGLNLCIVHRDRRGAMRKIEPEFERIRERGVSLLTFNRDALDENVRGEILDALSETLAPNGRVRVLLHSIAFGNLKLIGPEAPANEGDCAQLAAALGVEENDLTDLFGRGSLDPYGACDKEAMTRELGRIAKASSGVRPIWLFFMGHSNSTKLAVKFNMPGPDMSATDIAQVLHRRGFSRGGKMMNHATVGRMLRRQAA